MLMSLMEVKGRQFLMLTDNTVTEHAVRNGRSSDWWVDREWIGIQRSMLENKFMIKSRRVRFADNSADRLSRGLYPAKDDKDRLLVVVPLELRKFVIQE